jgi:hypothetical protein
MILISCNCLYDEIRGVGVYYVFYVDGMVCIHAECRGMVTRKYALVFDPYPLSDIH